LTKYDSFLAAYLPPSALMVFAREDGSLDWLANVASSSRDYGYQQYLTVDATLMSVRDMTSLLSGGFSLPRNCFVYAEQPLPDAESANLPTSVRLIQADAANSLQQISTNGIQNIAAEGSDAILCAARGRTRFRA
jgi:hypothetical protein